MNEIREGILKKYMSGARVSPELLKMYDIPLKEVREETARPAKAIEETKTPEPIIEEEPEDHPILQEYNFKKSDFEAMLCNPFALPDGTDMIKQFPVLESIESFKKSKYPPKVDRNKVIKFILLFYDRFSPAEIISDYIKKKLWCALSAGFVSNRKTGLFDKPVDDILKGMDLQANKMIIDYLRETGSNLYAQLKIGTDAYFSKLEQVRNTDKGESTKTDLELEKIRGDVWKQCIAMEVDLERMAEKFLKDKSLFLKESLFCTINNEAKQNLFISPEQRAGI